MCVLKNNIIIHRKVLENNQALFDHIFISIQRIDNNYDKYIINTMLNNIKNKNGYNNINFRNVSESMDNLPPIPAEERKIIETRSARYTKQIKKFPQMFKEDQIVGAKDKENNWWLARVLNVFTTPECDSHWYYVRFEGWGAKHDEWINARTYRVRNYNPKKHFLKRQLTK